jgi:hypothetical protein
MESKDWTEDLKFENGNYPCYCKHCNSEFKGHKYRFTCKECAMKPHKEFVESFRSRVLELLEGMKKERNQAMFYLNEEEFKYDNILIDKIIERIKNLC